MYIGTYVSMITYLYISIYVYVCSRFRDDCDKFAPRTHIHAYGYVIYMNINIHAYV